MLSNHLNKNIDTLTLDFVDSVGGLVLINIREYRWRERVEVAQVLRPSFEEEVDVLF